MRSCVTGRVGMFVLLRFGGVSSDQLGFFTSCDSLLNRLDPHKGDLIIGEPWGCLSASLSSELFHAIFEAS